MIQPDEIIKFWFGPGDDPYHVDDEISSRWFAGREEFDEKIRQRFGNALGDAVLSGKFFLVARSS